MEKTELHCLASRNCSFIKHKTGKDTHPEIRANLVGLQMSVDLSGKPSRVSVQKGVVPSILDWTGYGDLHFPKGNLYLRGRPCTPQWRRKTGVCNLSGSLWNAGGTYIILLVGLI